MSFQSAVNITQAPAVAGDFASANSRHSALTVEGGFVAGSGGVTIGRFAWADSASKVLINSGSGAPFAFVGNDHSALITTYLSEAGQTIPQGFEVGSVFQGGDFWVKNDGSGAATVGQKAFASNTTGQIQFAAAGATVAGYTETKWYAKTPGAAGELVKMSDKASG